MTVVDVHNLQKKKVSEVELKEEVFDVPTKSMSFIRSLLVSLPVTGPELPPQKAVQR